MRAVSDCQMCGFFISSGKGKESQDIQVEIRDSGVRRANIVGFSRLFSQRANSNGFGAASAKLVQLGIKT
jgi:hypothetical protein